MLERKARNYKKEGIIHKAVISVVLGIVHTYMRSSGGKIGGERFTIEQILLINLTNSAEQCGRVSRQNINIHICAHFDLYLSAEWGGAGRAGAIQILREN